MEVYYGQYLTALKHDDKLAAEQLRQRIIQDFPDTDYAKIVAQADYFERLKQMQQEQDSVYEATYNAYKAHNYTVVKASKRFAEDHYSLSKLMPRFLFLNAVAVAKTENQQAFIAELEDLVARYPESEMGAMAKDMLALMNQGEESKTGDSESSLLDKRAQIQQEEDSVGAEKTFSAERRQRSYLLITIDQNEQNLNELLYEVALFNFSQFLVKDFDLKLLPVFSSDKSALQVSGLDSYDEAVWYSGNLTNNPDLQQVFRRLDAQLIRITEENYAILGSKHTLEDYRLFQQKNGLE